jgi:hypothetical protein
MVGPATYTVTNFFYCNWVQELLDWPITVHQPAIEFTIHEKEVWP